MKSKQQIKRLLIVCTIMVLGLIQLASAQSWNIKGNTGINSKKNYLGTKDTADLIFRTNAKERGKLLGKSGSWQFGSSGNYANIDSTGKLSFNGKGDYLVGKNKYVFRYSLNDKYGLFFNFAARQYEFRDGSANPVFSVNYNTGVGTLTGDAVIHGITVGLGGNANYFNTAIGISALISNTSGGFNTANGYNALYSNTTGTFNTALGMATLFLNTRGDANTAIGCNSLSTNTSGYSNTAIGFSVLRYNTTGYSNVAVGNSALYNNTDRSNLVAVGDSALYNNGIDASDYSHANFNTAVGSKALYSNRRGSGNTANGYNALYSNTTGSNNTANGYQALYSNTTGVSNIAIGPSTLYSNTTGYYNTAIGANALLFNTSGNSNTVTGMNTLSANTTGSENTANGFDALESNTTGGANTATGFKALTFNTIGYNNTANGHSALKANTTGSYNSATGFEALLSNNTGDANMANGYRTLASNTTGYGNTANGNNALSINTTGYYNSAVGFGALNFNVTGRFNTALGVWADVSSNNLQNATALGYSATVNASNKVQVGNASVTVIGGQVGWSTFSDGRFKKNIKQNVPGLEFINKLNPVTYTLEIKKFDQFLGKKDSMINSKESQEGYAVGEKKIRTGFIAQEVEKTAMEIGYDFDGINHPQNDKDNYALVYADFVPSLVKAVQELNTNLQKQNDDLQKQIDELKILVANLSQGKNSSTSEAENKISLSSISLEQNIPNPLANSTSIGYFIPSNISNAQLIVTDMSGKNIKQISLQNGKGNITIDASTLSAGAYNYSLMVNGKVVATKRMVVAH